MTRIPYVPKPGDRPNPRQARDVSDVCSTRQTGCEVRGGVNGYELFVWEGTVDLPRCNSWRFTYKSCTCCRNGVQNFTGGSNTGLETFINTAWSPRTNPGGAPANSAPQFADEAKPFPSVCVGQDVFYGIGTYDGDGDSLRFIPVCPWATTGTGGLPNLQRMNPRGTGVSCTRALPGLVMDPATGLISFRQFSLSTDANSRILATTTTDKAAIGFTIHLLFLDEFAHVRTNIQRIFYDNIYPVICITELSG